MSAARQARRRAATDRREYVAQAHDALHHDDVASCHELLHGALGLEDVDLPLAPLLPNEHFDVAFRRLCMTHNVAAAYVREAGESDRGTRILTGGDALLCKWLVERETAREGSPNG